MQVRNSMHILRKNKSNYLYKTEIQTKCYLTQAGLSINFMNHSIKSYVVLNSSDR